MRKVTVYTDGACRGNPGPGGYGVILEYTDREGQVFRKELSAGFRSTTNNRMEVLAAVEALGLLKEPCEVTLYSDSKYLVDALRLGWVERWRRNGWYRDTGRKEKAKNIDLWQRLLECLSVHKVEFRWVKGHAQNPYNNRCDQLAVQAALNGSEWKEDPGAGS